MNLVTQEDLCFKALGTEWCITVAGKNFSAETKSVLLKSIEDFEERFSRFRPKSEVNAFREAKPGTYLISPEFAILLERAKVLRMLTDGIYDPAVAPLLEKAGYNSDYTFEEKEVEAFVLPTWDLKGRDLTLSGPIAFDLGGMGKGYCIDMAARILWEQGYDFYLVEGGGDMVGTEKSPGVGWQVGIEWPGKPDTLVGTVLLRNHGLAVSDSFRRRWKKWHHVINPITREPIQTILGCAALAQNAWDADSMTSGLFLASPDRYGELSMTLKAEYLVFEEQGTVRISRGWPGELF